MSFKKYSASLQLESVLIAQLESLLGLLRQMDLVDYDSSSDIVHMLNGCHKLLKKIAQDTTGYSDAGGSRAHRLRRRAPAGGR